MKFNSCIYVSKIGHQRLLPKSHSFTYKIYSFYLDLDELDILSSNLLFFKRNRANLYNFRDKDHLYLSSKYENKSTKESIIEYLKTNGVATEDIGKIFLLTNVVTAGYIFNPVSFFYVFDKKNIPFCAVVEVQNTFNELKPFLIPNSNWNGVYFEQISTKYFYVSPFSALDVAFHFKVSIPTNKLSIQIDDIENKTIILKTSFKGDKLELNDKNLMKLFFIYPFITCQIIFSIHFQALLLWLKRLKYFKKNEFLENQNNIYKPYQITLDNGN